MSAPALPDEPRPSAVRARVALLIAAVLTAAVDLGTKAWAFSALGAEIVTGYAIVPRDAPDAAPRRVLTPPPPDAAWTVVEEFPAVAEGARSVTVIPKCFEFRCSVNTGAVFGILGGRTAWVMLLTCVALGLIGWILWKADPRRTGLHVAFGLILGGALGNLWDRAVYAGVRDFIFWYAGTPARAWPTFNIADAALVVGIGLIIVMEMRQPSESPAPPAAPAA